MQNIYPRPHNRTLYRFIGNCTERSQFQIKIDRMGTKKPQFQFQANLAGNPCGIEIGYSKKEAQQNAAQIALTRVKNDQTFAQSILSAQKKQELNLSEKENNENIREQFSLSFTNHDSPDKPHES